MAACFSGRERLEIKLIVRVIACSRRFWTLEAGVRKASPPVLMEGCQDGKRGMPKPALSLHHNQVSTDDGTREPAARKADGSD